MSTAISCSGITHNKWELQKGLECGHPKTQTMQTADCRLQTVQTMQTVQTVQTEYFFFLFLFLYLLLTRICFGSGHIN